MIWLDAGNNMRFNSFLLLKCSRTLDISTNLGLSLCKKSLHFLFSRAAIVFLSHGVHVLHALYLPFILTFLLFTLLTHTAFWPIYDAQ